MEPVARTREAFTRDAARERLVSEARDLARERGPFTADIVGSHLAARRWGRLILIAVGLSLIAFGLFEIRALLGPGTSCLLCSW